MQPNLLSGLLNNASTSMKVVQKNAKKKEELAKKELGTLSNVVKTTTAVAKANTPQVVGGFGDKNNSQSLLELHKTTTGFQPLEFNNLMGAKQSGIPNLGFTQMGTQPVNMNVQPSAMDSITRDAQMVRDDAVSRQNTTDDKALKLMNQYTLSRDELFDLGAFKRKELEEQGEDTTGVDDVDLAEFALLETPEEEKKEFTRTGIIGSLQGAGIEGAEKQAQAQAREQTGQQGVLSTKLQDVGSVAGYGSDLIGDVVVGGLKKGGQLIDYITQGGASEVATVVGEKIKGTQFYNDVVAEGLNQLGQGIESYNKRKQANPVEGANVDALLNIVDVGSQFIGGGVAKKVGQEALESGVARTIKEGVETGLQKGIKGLGNIGKTAGGIVEGFGNKVSGATDYAAKKLIDSKFKLTKTNKDAIRKSAGVEPSEFILENNIGGNNIDEMVENTKNMVDDAMQTKFQALSEVKDMQPITQREKLIGQSIVKQAKGDIEEIYGKKFDEILEDEIVPELKEQFTIVNNIEKVINEREISPLKLEALKSLYDIYNSHLKYDLTKKRVLGAAEQIRLGLQSSIEGLGKTVGVDIKGLNKKIAGGKALEKGLIQAGDRLDNNNLFGLSDSQTAILSSALGGGGLEVAGVLGAKSLFENIGLRNKLARSLYTKKTPNVGPKIPNNNPSLGTTARSNITKQFGDSSSVVNGGKSNIQVKYKGLSNLKNKGDIPKIPPKIPKELPANIDKSEPLSRYAAGNRGLTDLSDAIVDWNNKGTEKDRIKLLSEFDTEKGKAYLNEVIESINKNDDGTITAYRTGKIGGNKPQSYTISEGMAKTFSNEGTDISIKNFGKSDNKDFGSLDTVKVKIDPKGIKGYSPFDKELLVDSKFVTTESQVSKNPLANLTPAKQKIADTPLSNLKNPKKSVKSDTLVSKSDDMGNMLNDYKNSNTSNYGPEQKQKTIDSIDYVVNGLRNSKTPAEMKDFISKIDLDYNYKNTFKDIALDRKLGFREYFEKFNPHNFDQKIPDELYKKLKNIFINKTDDNKPKNILAPKKDLQPLYNEAKKYKSVDEFMEGNKVYHGTNQEFNDFDIELGGKATSSMPSAKGNIFFTKDKSEAIAYAKNANKSQIVDQKSFDKRTEETQNKIERLEKSGKRDEADSLTQSFEEEYYKKINTLQAGKQVGPEIAMERYIDPTKIKEINIGGQITAGDLMKKLDTAKKEGYLGAKLIGIIDAPAEFFPNNKGTTQFTVWDKKALLDKSQLRKIREEANKKSPGLSNLKNK